MEPAKTLLISGGDSALEVGAKVSGDEAVLSDLTQEQLSRMGKDLFADLTSLDNIIEGP